jgi:hypothetical protein
MNSERLHVVILAIHDDFKRNKIKQLFEAFSQALQQMANQQHPSHQQQMAETKKQLDGALVKSPSNNFSPAWRQALEELELSNYVGIGLAAQIDDILNANQMTPAIAQQEVQKVYQQFETKRNALEQVVSGFSIIKIGKEQLNPGECEIGILIPRNVINNELDHFQKELHDISFILDAFHRTVIGQKSSVKLRTISSSDFSVFMDSLPKVAACMAAVVAFLINSYKSLLEIRKLHGELKKQGVPEEGLQGIDTHANSIMKKAVDDAHAMVIERYSIDLDQTQKNELSNHLRISISKLANRIDKGFNIEIRSEPLKQDKKPEEQTGSNDQEHLLKIRELAKTLEFLRLEGHSLLQLPESIKKKKDEE